MNGKDGRASFVKKAKVRVQRVKRKSGPKWWIIASMTEKQAVELAHTILRRAKKKAL